MVLRYASPEEIAAWDSFTKDNFLQSYAFSKVKSPTWSSVYIMAPNNLAVLVLTRKVLGVGTVAYVPAGPNSDSEELLYELVAALKQFFETNRPDIFLIKIEPRNQGLKEPPKNYIPAPDVQPSATIILPVSSDISTLGRRARRYIRVGEREGIVVKPVELSNENMHIMYKLMGSAFGGRGIPGLRSFSYYNKFWTTFQAANQGVLYFAYDGDTPVAGVFVVKMEKNALYKDGGSLHGRSSKGATYLIHWKIIEDLAADGFTSYDLWGSPPAARLNDPTHPLYGLASFKTAFSPDATDYVGVFDIVLNQRRYKRWQRVYPFLRRYLLAVKKEGFY